jgi:hypothetical protein
MDDRSCSHAQILCPPKCPDAEGERMTSLVRGLAAKNIAVLDGSPAPTASSRLVLVPKGKLSLGSSFPGKPFSREALFQGSPVTAAPAT